jgi:hypothetical protein
MGGPEMATCGNCHKTDQSVEHVRECYKQRFATLEAAPIEPSGFVKAYAQKAYTPMALAPVVPDSYYALRTENGIVFYRVRTGKKDDKWKGFQFVDRLVGHPGDWAKYPVMKGERHKVLNAIGADPLAAAKLYGEEHKVCAVCSSPLSDPESLAAGIGPICAKRF